MNKKTRIDKYFFILFVFIVLSIIIYLLYKHIQTIPFYNDTITT